MKNVSVSVFLCLVLLAGCAAPETQTKTQKGAIYGAAGGAAAGAIVGQVISHDTKGTLIGAAIGAAVGGLGGAGVGKMMDDQERDMRKAVASSEAASVSREGNLLAVKNLLVQRGIADSRIEAVGYGETLPVATNDTEAGRQRNRRVEIKIAPQTQQ